MSQMGKNNEVSGPFVKFQQELQNLFNNFGGNWYDHSPSALSENMLINPKVNISETKNNFNIMLEMPGVEKQNIHITRDHQILTVTAEKKHSRKDDHENFYHVECSYGTITRSIKLPSNIKESDIAAELIDGVLYITIPKQQGENTAHHHHIPIK